jgi:hypothetical protein
MSLSLGFGLGLSRQGGGGAVAPLAVEDGYLVEAFDTPGDWAATNGSVTAGNGFKADGVELTATGTVASMVKSGLSFSVKDWDAFMVYAGITDPQRIDSFDLYLGTDDTFANAYKASWACRDVREPGPQWISAFMNGMTVVGSIKSIDEITAIKLVINSGTSGGAISLSDLCYGRRTKPQIVVQFDDNWAEQYSEAFSYMGGKGLKGTVFAIQNRVGTAGYTTLAQLQEMYAAGWDIGNHTLDHAGFNHSSSGDTDDVATAQQPTDDFTLDGGLASSGSVALTDPCYIVVTPATSNEVGKSVTITGTDENDDAQTDTVWLGGTRYVYTSVPFKTVTAASISEAAEGNIQIGISHTYQETYDSLKSCRDYLVSNGMPRAAKYVAFPYGETNPFVDQAMSALGLKTGRLAAGGEFSGLVMPTAFGLPNPFAFPGYIAPQQAASSEMIDVVAQAIATGASVHLCNHQIDATGSTTIAVKTADFEALIDYIAGKVTAGVCDAPTISEWFTAMPKASAPLPADIPAFVASKQLLRYPQDLSFATYWDGTNLVSAATGVTPPDGIASDEPIWIITDSGSGYNGIGQNVAVASGDTKTVHGYVLKDQDVSRFPEIRCEYTSVSGRNYRIDINTKTGEWAGRNNGASATVSIEDAGDWWHVIITVTNSTATILGFGIYAAIGDVIGAANSAATGSVTVCAWMVNDGATAQPYERRYT